MLGARAKGNALLRAGNVVNGWWIVHRWVEIKQRRKRAYIEALCPKCDAVVSMRSDHITKISQCVRCYEKARTA